MRNIPIRSKLLILVCIPLLSIIVTSFNAVKSKLETKSVSSQLVSLTKLAGYSGNLVHEMQKERGSTAIFLQSFGRTYKEELSQQRLKTDSALDSLNSYIEGNEWDHLDPSFIEHIQLLTKELSNLTSLRESISALEVKPGEAIGTYTGYNNILLETVGIMMKLGQDVTLTNLIGSYYFFLQSKERAGIERAVVSQIFTKGFFTQADIMKFSKLVEAQESYMRSFLTVASPDHVVYYEHQIKDASFSTVADMRNVALTMPDSNGYSIAAPEWFATITGKINILKGIENRLSADVFNEATRQEAASFRTLILYSGSSLALIIFVLVVCLYVIKSITNPLIALKKAAREVADGNNEVDVPIMGKDEIGRLSASFNEMVASIRDSSRKIAFEQQQTKEALDTAESSRLSAELAKDEALAAKSNAEVALNDAEEAKAEAMKAKSDAEASAMEAEAALKKAEASEAEALAAKAGAEASKREAEDALKEAEASKAEALKAKNEAEASQKEALEAQKIAEASKAEAEAALQEAEVAKAQAEESAAEALKAKSEAEASKSKAEAALKEAEVSKSEAEAALQEAEVAKAEAEKSAAEALKAKSEAEVSKSEAEAALLEAESAKAQAEVSEAEAVAEKEKASASEREALVAKANAEESKQKAEGALLEAEASKAEALKAKQAAEASSEEAHEAQEKAEASKREAETALKEAEVAKADAEASAAEAMAEKEKARASEREAARAMQEALESKAHAEQALSEAGRAKDQAENALKEAELAKEEAIEAQTEAESLKDQADKARIEIERTQEEAIEARKELERSVELMLEKIDLFAKGDLTVRLPESNHAEINKLYKGFNTAVQSVRRLIEDVTSTINKTQDVVSSISVSSSEILNDVGQQVEQAIQIAAAAEEMTQTVAINAENASSAASLSTQSGEVAREGSEIIRKAVDVIKEVTTSLQDSASLFDRLEKSGLEIGKTTSVIEQIARQTKLLALNARIEAEHAAEKGSGFAVVAKEVGQLAEETTSSTADISGMIRSVQNDTGTAITSMESCREIAKKGVSLADNALQAISEIDNKVGETVYMANQIARAAVEQKETSNEITKNIEGISRLTQKSQERVGNIVESVERLTDQTEALSNVIGKFKTSSV